MKSFFSLSTMAFVLVQIKETRAYPSLFSFHKHEPRCSRGVHNNNRNRIQFNKFLENRIDSSPLLHLSGGDGVGNLRRIFFNRRTFVGGVLGGVAAIFGGGEIYSRLGDGKKYDRSLTPPEKGWDNIEEAMIVFHGAAGPDRYTDELSKKCRKQGTDKNYYTQVDWSDYSQDTLQASFNGQIIGEKIATEITQKAQNLKSLHIVGISVGAFAADTLVKKFKENTEKDVFVQLTLLDPFCLRGTLGFSYGANHYGLNADYAQQYLNTDDPVPSTNSPLPKCAVTDITNVRPPNIFGHDWPLVYYTRYCDVGLVSKSNQRPRGDVVYVNALPSQY